MSRPPRCRLVRNAPAATLFKPAGAPARELAVVALQLDELEALRLADFEGLYQEDAAARMDISRPTFARLIETARRKVADALLHGKAVMIQGGPVMFGEMRTFECAGCGHHWQTPHGGGRPAECPACHGGGFHRAADERGRGAGRGRGASEGCGRADSEQGGRGAGGGGRGRCRRIRGGRAGDPRLPDGPGARDRSTATGARSTAPADDTAATSAAPEELDA